MEDFSKPYETRLIPRIKPELINGNGYDVTGIYVIRSRPSIPLTTYDVSKAPTYMSLGVSSKSKGLLNGKEIKRRKRFLKYKMYAIEGKVKASLKKGYRWFKRRCSEIIHGI